MTIVGDIKLDNGIVVVYNFLTNTYEIRKNHHLITAGFLDEYSSFHGDIKQFVAYKLRNIDLRDYETHNDNNL